MFYNLAILNKLYYWHFVEKLLWGKLQFSGLYAALSSLLTP